MTDGIDKLEDIANQEFTIKLTQDQAATMLAVHLDWVESHQDRPEAQDAIRTLKSINVVRTR
jgi:hypothetical protein